MRTITVQKFVAEAKRRFGEKPALWKVKCPRCGTPQTAEDFREYTDLDDATIATQIGYSCIGRHTEEMGCDWTLGGLFRIHELEIIDPEGNPHPHFELADPEATE